MSSQIVCVDFLSVTFEVFFGLESINLAMLTMNYYTVVSKTIHTDAKIHFLSKIYQKQKKSVINVVE